MNETAKAMRRRYIEDFTGQFEWLKIFRGRGIDVGCGPDKLPFSKCIGFDLEDGDANKLDKYFRPNTFDYLHASQCLEHMHDPYAALDSWIRVVRPEGHLIFTVPDYVLYEQLQWPSRFNPDHKSSWSLYLTNSRSPQHIYVPDFLMHFGAADGTVDPIHARLIDKNYDYSKLGTLEDQTIREEDGVECWVEVVMRKR